MKHRHKLRQQQRLKPASASRRLEVDKTAGEQPSSGVAKVKKSSMHSHDARKADGPSFASTSSVAADGRATRYDNGGPAGSSAASTRSADDPGGELATATKERKSTADWIKDEVLGGTKPAYSRGGGQRPKKFDAGGATAPPIAFGSPSLQDIAFSPKPNPLVAMIQKNMPPVDTAGKIMAARAAASLASLQKNTPSFPGSPKVPGSKQGGRAGKRGTAR